MYRTPLGIVPALSGLTLEGRDLLWAPRLGPGGGPSSLICVMSVCGCTKYRTPLGIVPAFSGVILEGRGPSLGALPEPWGRSLLAGMRRVGLWVYYVQDSPRITLGTFDQVLNSNIHLFKCGIRR
jgi:hypothetical protein